MASVQMNCWSDAMEAIPKNVRWKKYIYSQYELKTYLQQTRILASSLGYSVFVTLMEDYMSKCSCHIDVVHKHTFQTMLRWEILKFPIALSDMTAVSVVNGIHNFLGLLYRRGLHYRRGYFHKPWIFRISRSFSAAQSAILAFHWAGGAINNIGNL